MSKRTSNDAVTPGRRRGVLRIGVASLIAIALASCTPITLVKAGGVPTHTSGSAGQATSGGTRTGATEAATPGHTVGVDTVSGYFDLTKLTDWETATARKSVVLQTTTSSWLYSDGNSNAFPATRAAQVAAHGNTLQLTWQPTDPQAGSDQPAFNLAAIAAGRQDVYIINFAEAVKKFGKQIQIRLAHEMNGSWSPWSIGTNGNRVGDYVAAWRHVHDLFGRVGAANVTWVWAPNVIMPGGKSVKGLYPGDNYVDVIGMDGYSYPKEGCRSAQNVFEPLLADIEAFAHRPITIQEVAVSQSCANRPGWIKSFFAWMRSTHIIGFTWWERPDPNGDYRIVNDPAALAAFKQGLASY